jgi:hypothetical protein
MRLREGAFGRAPTFGRVASYRAAKTPRDRAACGVSSHSGDGRSRGASGEGVSSSPAMERAASAPAEPCASPVASIRWVVRRRQPPCPPATSHAEAHPRLPMRQGAAAVRPRQPACGGSFTAFRPKRASSLGCHGRTAAAKARMTAGKWVSAG